ncbi:MAG: hypothetical protein ABFS42_02445 [Candidatus Krumholzibacteriota bacterium]
MKTRIYQIILVGALLLVLPACQENPPTSVAPPGQDGMHDKFGTGQTGYCDPVLHDTFEGIWNGGGDVISIYETKSINPWEGDTWTINPPGWPEGYEIKMEFFSGTTAVGYPVDSEILFGISIPVDSPSGTGSPAYEFFPDGIQFNQDVKVTLCWPPWAGEPPSGPLDLIFLEREVHEEEYHYRAVDIVQAWSAASHGGTIPEEDLTLLERSTGFEFFIDHFSRWGVTSGSDDGGTGGDKLPGMDDFDPDGDGEMGEIPCWTSFPPPEYPPLLR